MSAFIRKNMPRRDFLAVSAAAAAAAVVPASAVAADAEWVNRQPGMQYRRLGRTGLMVSLIAMGGDDIRPNNNDFVYYAMDLGLNYFDTAPQYGGGLSEKGYGDVIKTRGRDKVIQNTKVNVFPNRTTVCRKIYASLPEAEQNEIRDKVAEEVERRGLENPDYLGPYFTGQAGGLRQAMIANEIVKKYRDKIDPERDLKQYIYTSVENSLKSFGTDHLDCLLMRGIETPWEVKNTPEVIEAFEQLKKQGKARFLGFSAHSDPAGVLEAAIETPPYSMGLVAYHFLNHRWLGPVIEKAKKADFGVMCMKASRVLQNPVNRRQMIPDRVKALEAVMPGDMSPFQKGFAWAMQNPNLTGVVAGMTNMDHAKENVPLALEKKA